MKPIAQKQILLVEDDLIAQKIVEALLEKEGFTVTSASSADQALKSFTQKPLHFFECVITDYQLPGMNGMDLLKTIQQTDPTLAVILITVKEDRELIQESFREGACDFLNKPIQPNEFNTALTRALETTNTKRQRQATETGLQEAQTINALFSKITIPEGAPPIYTFFHPRHKVGGDFLNLISFSEGNYALILGDVSGHDLRSTLLSVYFQGLMKGVLKEQGSLKAVISTFNTLLSTEWAEKVAPKKIHLQNSLSICALEPNIKENTLTLINCGFPYPFVVTKDGRITQYPESCYPLGWFEDCPFQKTVHPLDSENDAFIYAFTDGLQDHANQLKMDLCALAYRLFKNPEEKEQILKASRDDILISKIQVCESTDPGALPHPLIFATYKGTDYEFIDEIQSQWEHSLMCAFPGSIEERLNEILLCTREMMLNAFIHACACSEEQSCTLQVTFTPATSIVKVRVDDTGPGHTFNIETHKQKIAEQGPNQKHLGLVLISEMSDSISIEDKGTSIVCEFSIPPEEIEESTSKKEKEETPS